MANIRELPPLATDGAAEFVDVVKNLVGDTSVYKQRLQHLEDVRTEVNREIALFGELKDIRAMRAETIDALESAQKAKKGALDIRELAKVESREMREAALADAERVERKAREDYSKRESAVMSAEVAQAGREKDCGKRELEVLKRERAAESLRETSEQRLAACSAVAATLRRAIEDVAGRLG